MRKAIQQRYPLMVTDLNKTELKMLIHVLNLEFMVQQVCDNLGRVSEARDDSVHSEIKKLPSDLRKSTVLGILPPSIVRAAVLCPTHQGLNSFIIGHIFRLIKREVAEHLDAIVWYLGKLDESHKALVHALQAIQGMWTLASLDNHPPPVPPAPYQENKCEACMLGRVVRGPLCLKNLRTALISRTRTRGRHRAPRLLAFVEQAIHHYGSFYLELWHDSGQAAFDFKLARKAAVKAYRALPREVREGYNSRRRKHPKDKGKGSRNPDVAEQAGGLGHAAADPAKNGTESIVIYMDHDAAEKQGMPREPRRKESVWPQEAEITYLGQNIAKQQAILRHPSGESVRSQGAEVMYVEPMLQHPSGETARSQEAGIFNKRDTITEEILSTYRAYGSREWAPRSNTDLPSGVPPVPPLSIPKSNYSTISGSYYPDDHRVTQSSYIPPRSNPNWQNANHETCPVDDALLTGIQALTLGKAAFGGTAENLAMGYRDEVLCPAAGYDSDSDYSQASWEDIPVREPGPADTTWSLLYKEIS